jgi:AraC-like DNA-binding protein
MKPLVGDLGSALVRRIGKEVSAVSMLLGYAGVLSSLPSDAPAELQHLMATHVCDLVALALGATRDAAQTAMHRGVRAARLRAIKQDIIENISHHHLSADTIAARQRISVSYLRKMFEGDGTTFTDFVLEQRLVRVHRRVTDPRFAGEKLSAIAYDAGFGDLSYFNRVFRRRYGCTPSEARTQALGQFA